MRVTVELTFADYDEAAAAVRGQLQDRQQKQARRSPGTMLFAVAVGLIVFLLLMFGRGAGIDPMPQLRPPMYFAISLVIPFGCLIGFVIVAAMAQRWGVRSSRFGPAVKVAVPSLLLLIALAGIFWINHRLSALPGVYTGAPGAQIQTFTPPSKPDWYGTLAPHVPWIVIIALLSFFTVIGTRRQSRQSWDAQEQTLSRVKIFELTVYGVTVDEQVTQRQYRWAGFVRFIETKNLFLLCPNDLIFETLPKRCFASTEEIHAARALIDRQITEAKPQRGFPVAASAPAPLPQPID